MGWFSDFLTSSLGRKVVMSLSGLFLMLFLVIHLIGNIQLLAGDGGEKFNIYTQFMTHNPIIKTISYILYVTILLHAVQGTFIWAYNRQSKGVGYAVKTRANASWASRYMFMLGVVIFVFLVVHLYQFWLQMKLGNTAMVSYGEEPVKNLYILVEAAFTNIFYVVFYVVAMIFLGYHLWHGFQSAFQTLGLNHTKYNKVIEVVGKFYAVAVSAGFAIIPLIMYFSK